MWCSIIGVIVTLSLSILVALRVADAQPVGKMYRIGLLNISSANARPFEVFTQALRELGYVEGQNLVIEERYAEGQVERMPDLATELVRLKVDVILAVGSATARAAQQATSTIPIVMALATNAVAQVRRQPGTARRQYRGGVWPWGGVKRETAGAPQRGRARGLAHRRPLEPANPSTAPFVHATQAAAQALGVELRVLRRCAPPTS